MIHQNPPIMFKRNKTWQNHLPTDDLGEMKFFADSAPENLEMPANIVTNTLDEYYRELQNFDPEDPGSVVHEESKHPMFCYKVQPPSIK